MAFINDHNLINRTSALLSNSSVKAVAALLVTALVAYPIASSANSQANNSYIDSSTTATETEITVSTQTEQELGSSDATQETNIVTKTPEGVSIQNAEGDVTITSRPSSSSTYSTDTTVNSSYSSSSEEVVTEGQTTVEYNDPNSGEPTTIVQGGNKSVNKSSNVSISIQGNGDDTNTDSNEVEVENKTKIRIRGDSP